MYAVVKTGGKQYRVEPGMLLDVELLDGEVGQAVELDQVLLVSHGDGGEPSESSRLDIGTPLVSGAKVTATILQHKRGPKLIIFKKRRRHGYRKKKGHRQELTRLEIKEITLG